jgi:hypothetical protein
MADSLLDLGSDTNIFTYAVDWSSNPSIGDDFGRETIQENQGQVAYRTLTTDLNCSVQYGFTNLSKADEYNILAFFHARQGRLERFWLPIYPQLFTLAAAISSGSNQFQIVQNSAYKMLHLYERLFIKTNSGDLITRKFLANPANDIFTTVSAFDRNIALADVMYFSRLILCRFDQDKIEMKHETDSVSSCSIKFKELSKEYDLAFGGS